MCSKTFFFTFIAVAFLNVTTSQAQKRPVDYVNPFIGASTNTKDANNFAGLGKTFPGADTPFGMVQVSPNTITGGDNGSGYSYEHKTIEGFAMTQMSGVGWYGDLGNFLMMPTNGELKTVAGKEDGGVMGWRSHYDKSTERVSAGYYSAVLTDYNIKAECSATTHCGCLRFTFSKNKQSRIQVDLARRVGGSSSFQSVKVVDDNTIEGFMRCTPDGGGWGNGDGKANYTVFFHAHFSKPLKKYGFWSADIPDDWQLKNKEVQSAEYLNRVAKAQIILDKNDLEGRNIGFFTEFETAEKERVEVKVGISFVDLDGARRNYDSEIKDLSFDEVHKNAVEAWNSELKKVSVKGGSEDDKTVFYTALYHAMLDPRTYQDVDGRYVGGDYKIHNAGKRFTKRTIFSGWDVFRSEFPLLTLIAPKVVNDELNSLITLADESGRKYYERWEFLNAYSGCMVGNPAISVIADAYSKGLRNYDVSKAYEFAVNSSRMFGNDGLGYTPGNSGISCTLEYSYTDWCLYRLATQLGKYKDALDFYHKSQAYRNVFDKRVGWFRPRNADGTWMPWPAEGRLKEGYGCVESNPLQQGWFVPHDVKGMVSLMGGRQKVIADLNNMFRKTPRNFLWNKYYNHSNEPVHLIPYLFNRLNAPWLTQKWTRTICRNAYKNGVNGLCGNEDVGQMSAWYVLSSAGIHQSCPGDMRVEITSPMFSRITFSLDNRYYQGKTFTIVAHNNSSTNIYIQKIRLNGKPLRRTYLNFSDIVSGGTLELFMGAKPARM
jgi:predicted alpha-1,2-mannosidase